jgi:hypothetical protein
MFSPYFSRILKPHIGIRSFWQHRVSRFFGKFLVVMVFSENAKGAHASDTGLTIRLGILKVNAKHHSSIARIKENINGDGLTCASRAGLTGGI